MKPIFQQSSTLTFRLIVFSSLSVLLMTLEYRTDVLKPVRDELTQITYPIQYIVSLPSRIFDWTSNSLATRSRLIFENASLRKSQLLLQSRLQKLGVLEAENVRLQKLLQSSKKIKQRVLIAKMLAVDTDPYRQNITINKGSSHGVFIGQAVIDALGVMGQISQVANHSATALLISDPSHSIPVSVVRNGLRSVAKGLGQSDQIELNFIPGNGDIEVGDKLVSSGLGGRFPRDFPVATVSKVDRPLGKPFATVFATPAAELDRSHEILLVWQETLPLDDEDAGPVGREQNNVQPSSNSEDRLALHQRF